MRRRFFAFVLFSLAALMAAGLAVASVQNDLARKRDMHGLAYIGSGACARCHPDHDASWRLTFHRTMTRPASRETVLAPFDGESLEYGGITARAFASDDEFRIEYGSTSARVDRVVGSRRIQQYLTRRGDTWWRLPVAWHREEQRWIHMNETFLTPDPEGMSERAIATGDYERHMTRWNDNCIFCHNVAPNPGLDPDGTFASEVAELGVACEACHGPGAEHAARNANPVRRYWLHSHDQSDPTIVSPARLSVERSTDICGRCHGQRMSDEIEVVLAHGDRYLPGDDLALYSSPLWIDTTVDEREGEFALRFYGDGTPRLTAYEYQGLLESRCHVEGGLACGDCHSMHRSDPRGQLRTDRPGDAMCTAECHASLASDGEKLRHSAHRDIECVDCHMPEIVYGIQTIHRSHRIDSPRLASDRPDACALCHLERPTGGEPTWSAALAGDPIVRAVLAYHLGSGTDSGAASTLSLDRARRIGLLLTIFRDDPYSAVRTLARRSLEQLDVSIDPRLSASGALERGRAVDSLSESLVVEWIDPAPRAELQRRASQMAIQIGE